MVAVASRGLAVFAKKAYIVRVEGRLTPPSPLLNLEKTLGE